MIARVSGSVLSLCVLLVVGCGAPMEAANEQAQVTQSQHSLTIEINSDALQIAADQPALVEVSYTNEGDQPIQVLSWTIPSEDLWVDMFSVSLQGVEVPYVGRIYKRVAEESDYVELQAGETIKGSVDLSRLYDFEITGEYDVRVQVESMRLLGQNATAEPVASNWIQMDVEGRQNYVPEVEPEVEIGAYYKSPTFSSCSSTRKTKLRNALSSAESYAVGGYKHLRDQGYTQRYYTWFGTYSSSRFNRAYNTMYNIKYVIKNKTIRFYCDCNDNAFAWVYASQPYKIHICSDFWNAPRTGTNSKAGTIVHELSHFNVVSGTDDHVYGVSDSKWLASNYPDYAVDNADNYEYFCERPNG